MKAEDIMHPCDAKAMKVLRMIPFVKEFCRTLMEFGYERIMRGENLGSMVNCASEPITTSFGRENTTRKSCGFIVRPMPNITIPSIGAIHPVMIHENVHGNNSDSAATVMTSHAMLPEMKSHIIIIII